MKRPVVVAAVLGLLAVLCVELALSSRQQSQTFDEACHILAGVHYWRDRDFGINPEHPPLVKLVAALPLLRLPLRIPAVPNGYFKAVEYFAGRDFMSANSSGAVGGGNAGMGVDAILFRSRMAAAIFTVVLAVGVFAAATQMFGAGAGMIALLLLVFEPNLLAHGALVTTDVGVTCCMFLAVYAFYRYVRKPSALALVATGVAAGLTLAAKHSGLLVLPVLALLAAGELWRGGKSGAEKLRAPQTEDKLSHEESSAAHGSDRTAAALHLGGALLLIGTIAFVVVWAFYGFRYAARPAGLALAPDLPTLVASLSNAVESAVIQTTARWHALPEAYLFGLADVLKTGGETPGFLFGKVYTDGSWLYFPAVLVIKSTLGFLALLLLLPVVFRWSGAMRRDWKIDREMMFLAIPAAFYFLIAAASSLNLGVRHILPVYPFLLILAAYCAWTLGRRNVAWAGAMALLLLLHVASSARAFPNYIPYANELAGGPGGAYKVLSESNVDWGQSLKAMKRYVDQRQITDCWFADFASLGVDPASYGIPCRSLPAGVTRSLSADIVPPSISGPVFISATELSGSYWGPAEMNPYAQFMSARPNAAIGDSIFVFEGRFDVPLLSAFTHEGRAAVLAQSKAPEQALAEAQAASALAPNSVDAQATLGDTLAGMQRFGEAREAFQKALTLAQTVHPEYQSQWIAPLQLVLQRLPPA